MPTASAASPESALFVRPDALGDLVVFSAALRALHAAWPSARIAVVVQHPGEELGRLLLPNDIKWIPTSLNPYVSGPEHAASELSRLLKEVERFAPALFVAACPRRTWLDAALAAAVPKSRRFAFVSAAPDPYYEVPLRFELKIDTASSFPEILPALPEPEDWKRSFGLVSALLGKPIKPTAPHLELPADLLSKADEILAGFRLQPGHFITCAAAGFGNVFLKTWPADRFASVLAWASKEHGRRTLLIGHATERDYLARIAREAGGPEHVELWTGGEGDLATLAALIARAELHFGNDTGAVHLAAALGTPSVTLFGGGTWPRFIPASDKALSVVHPLPCFGCDWDCAFGDAPCVKWIGTKDAQRAIEAALAGRFRPAQITLSDAFPETEKIMDRAAAISRERSSAHLERQRKLQEIAYLAREKDTEIATLKSATNEKDAEIVALKRATDEKDAEIRTLAQAAQERLAGLEANHRMASEAQAQLADLTRECEALRHACNERAALIDRLTHRIRQLEPL